MVDSLTSEDIERITGYLDLSQIHAKADYEREFERMFGVRIVLKNAVWDKKVWQTIIKQYQGKVRSWDQDEIAFLHKYKHMRPIWIVKHFPTPRTYHSVYNKLRKIR